MWTVYVNGELYTDLINGISSNGDWSRGGVIFTELEYAEAFIEGMKQFSDSQDCTFDIYTVTTERLNNGNQA